VAGKSVKLSTTSFRDAPICELCLEDALKAGAAKSEKLKPQDFKETSMRFCVDGLHKCLKSFSKHYTEVSLFGVIRDLSWYWASFCSTDEVLVGLVREYYALIKNLTEDTDFTDLYDRADEPLRVKEIGRSGYPFNVSVPAGTYGCIQDCAVALGTSFSVFYQVGIARALSSDSQGRYSTWSATKFVPLFDEFMQRAKARLVGLEELRDIMNLRLAKKG